MSIPPVRPRDRINERDYDNRDHRRNASRNEAASSPVSFDQRSGIDRRGGGTISRSGPSDNNIKQDDWVVDESASK